jgi:membrane-associated phospholipid phosphatase
MRGALGEALATLVSNLVGPVGVAVLVAVVLRSVWNGRPAPAEIVRILATLGAGVILVGELKEFLDRPRPGAEFAGPSGASFPSGHVGNTVLVGIAVLALWYGGSPRPVGRRARVVRIDG